MWLLRGHNVEVSISQYISTTGTKPGIAETLERGAFCGKKTSHSVCIEKGSGQNFPLTPRVKDTSSFYSIKSENESLFTSVVLTSFILSERGVVEN